jgi:hypothetical protein
MKTLIQRFVFTVILIIPLLGYSQTRKLTGTVVSFNTYPVNNVTVQAKKAKTEAITNENGEFEIEVKNNDVIRIKESVFLEYNQKVNAETESLKINLIFDNSKKNVDVATNTGYISRENLEYGLENLAHENNVYRNFTDTYEAIRWALPEVTIITENGKKGIRFRGPKTITGSNAALLLVDGVIVDDVSFLNPVQIISISKLNTSAASLYGSRAANGVISIRTK